MPSERIYGIFIFGIAFNVLFGVFGFALTQYPSQPASLYNGTLPIDVDKFTKEGIYFSNATVFNVSWMAPWVEFSHNQVDARAGFREGTLDPIIKDGFRIQGQNIMGGWQLPYEYPFEVGEYYEWRPEIRNLDNSSIVTFYETKKSLDANNWTRFKAGENLIGFLLPRPEHNHNMTHAVYVDGNMTVILGEPVSFLEDYDFKNFMTWYWTALFTFNTTSVPLVLSVFLKLILTLVMVAGLIIAREMLPLI
jgi:hypothetical protein